MLPRSIFPGFRRRECRRKSPGAMRSPYASSLRGRSRTIRLKADEANCRIELVQSPARANKCSARTESCHKVRNFAVRLFPYLIRGRAVMRLPICGIAVLVRIEICLGICGNEFANTANLAISSFIAQRHYQFRAIRNKNAFALMRCAMCQEKFNWITERGTDRRVRDARVTARGIHDCFPKGECCAGQL